ncbi:hypothetical protein [Nocardia sp. CDC159]|uniref:hypothetical protein n=1 Tax=Nocardia sp. CDC159 TaxID=2951409 RepID=UPI0020730376|nr:hypothetical protein [Nocardia sp. CDC159]
MALATLACAGVVLATSTARADVGEDLRRFSAECKKKGYTAVAGFHEGEIVYRGTRKYNSYDAQKSFRREGALPRGACVKVRGHVEGHYASTDYGWVKGNGGDYQYFYNAVNLDGSYAGYWVRDAELHWIK